MKEPQQEFKVQQRNVSTNDFGFISRIFYQWGYDLSKLKSTLPAGISTTVTYFLKIWFLR